MSSKAHLVFQPDLNGRCPGRNDNGFGVHGVFAVDRERERFRLEMNRIHVTGQKLRAEPFRLGPHFLHELRAHDALGKAGIVFDLCRRSQLSAGLPAFYEQRREIRPCGIDRGGESCRPRADNHDVSHTGKFNTRGEGMHGCELGEEAQALQ